MSDRSISFLPRSSALSGLIVFLVLLILTQFLAYQRYQMIMKARRESAMHEAMDIRDRFNNALSNSLSATRTLAYIVEQHGVPKDFDQVASNILASNANIDIIQLTREGVITHVYPKEGNEAALGYDIFSNPSVEGEAQKAIGMNKLFFAGPMELRQGGVGVVGRLPIYRSGEFYGFSAVVIRLSTILKTIGIDTPPVDGFRYQISKINPVTGKEQFFLPGNTFSDGLAASINVPDGEWKLYVIPENDTSLYHDAIILSVLGVVLAFVAGLFSYHLTVQPVHLERMVEEKTEQLMSFQQNYRATLERVSDAFVALDNDWCYTFINKRAGEIFKLDPDTMIGKHIWTAFPEVVGKTLYRAYYEAMEEQKYIRLEEYYPPNDLWFESHIYPSPNGLSIYFRDITESKKSHQRLVASERYFRALIENSTDAIVLMSKEGEIVYMSPSTTRISGYTMDELRGLREYSLVHPDDRAEDIKAFERILASPGVNINRNHRLKHKSGHYIWLEGTYLNLLHDPDISAIIYNYHEITDRIEAEEKILLEKNLSESTINSLPGIFYLYDQNLKFFRWNQNFEKVSGYTSDEIAHMSPVDFFDDDEKLLLRTTISEVFSSGSGQIEAHFYTRDARKIPYYFTGSKVKINNEDYLIGMGIDISARVNAELKMKERTEEIQKLTAYLHHVREEERTHISREIHDELGQQLTGLKMDVAWVTKKISPEQHEIREKIRSMLELIDHTIRTVRRISSDLRPGMLDDLGLVAALEWYSQDFAARTNIHCTFDSNVETINLERNVATNIFRVFQETLTNVARHSGASMVTAMFSSDNNKIRLTIRDNGHGFDSEAIRAKKSLGLIGMRERAILFGGTLFINSKEGAGTIVTLELPIMSVADNQVI